MRKIPIFRRGLAGESEKNVSTWLSFEEIRLSTRGHTNARRLTRQGLYERFEALTGLLGSTYASG